MTLAEPQLQFSDARPYAAIRTVLRPPAQVEALAPLMWAEVRSWLAFEGRLEAGPPFVRYFRLGHDGSQEIEAGLTVFSPLHRDATRGSGRVVTGVLPAGGYATVLHEGPYNELAAARRRLQEWALGQGLSSAGWSDAPEGALLEFHLREQETEIAFHVAEGD